MSSPIRVAQLNVRHDDDTITRHGEGVDTAVGYYVHRHGLDVVDAGGDYVARYRPEQFTDYTGFAPAHQKENNP